MTLAVFLVEDEPSIQDSLKVVIEGFMRAKVVGAAQSEAEAVLWLQANPGRWHLAVVDLFLKQGTGLGVLTALSRQTGRKGVVVALTNAASPGNRAQCLRLGADAVFDKSAEVNEFLAYCAASKRR